MKKEVFEQLVVVKRSGQRVSFNEIKIAIAIKKAFDSTFDKSDSSQINKVYECVLQNIENNYIDRKTINVEDIQDIILNELKNLKYDKVYTSFSEYRERRAISRELCDEKNKHKFTKSIEKITNTCSTAKFNNPVKLSFDFGKTILKDYIGVYILENKYAKAYEEGKIYVHNLEFFPFATVPYCHLNLQNINKENIIDYTNAIKNINIDVFKEISIPSIDYVLEDFIKEKLKKEYYEKVIEYLELKGLKEYINIKKIYDDIYKIETFENFEETIKCAYNEEIKYLFKKAYDKSLKSVKENVYMYLKNFINELDKNDHKFSKCNYTISFGTNITFEGRMINEIMINIIDELSNNTNYIYKIQKNINDNEENINYEQYKKIINLISLGKNIAISINDMNKTINTSKYDIEYFMDGTKIYENVYKDKRFSTGRVVLGETSINLALLGIKSTSSKSFYEQLNKVLELCKSELISLFEIKANKNKNKNNYKYLLNYNLLIDSDKLEENQKIRKILKHGIFKINITGLKECLYSLKKKSKLTLEDLALANEIVSFIKKRCNKHSEELNLNFVVSETNEKEIYEYFYSIDASVYGKINNVTDKTYSKYNEIYENINVSLEKYIECEAKMQTLFTGGYPININLNKKTSNKEIEEIIKLLKKYKVNFAKFNKKENKK